VVHLTWGADVRDLGHLEVEDRSADEGRNDSSIDLSIKRQARGDVHVVGELEVRCEADGLDGGHIAVRLEVVHGVCVAGEPQSAKHFRYNVECNFNVGGRSDDTNRHDKYYGQQYSIKNNGR